MEDCVEDVDGKRRERGVRSECDTVKRQVKIQNDYSTPKELARDKCQGERENKERSRCVTVLPTREKTHTLCHVLSENSLKGKSDPSAVTPTTRVNARFSSIPTIPTCLAPVCDHIIRIPGTY
jgi:hypothetical protein